MYVDGNGSHWQRVLAQALVRVVQLLPSYAGRSALQLSNLGAGIGGRVTWPPEPPVPECSTPIPPSGPASAPELDAPSEQAAAKAASEERKARTSERGQASFRCIRA